MTASSCEVAILGAGPYGLASAAHLRAAGIEAAIFGVPMTFWERNMPVGMLLRSQQRSSNISDPERALTLADFARATGTALGRPLPLETFVTYGHWFQQHVAPNVDRRRVERIDRTSSGFVLALDDGEALRTSRVVVAAGIAPFAWSPEVLSALPPSFITHSSKLRDVAALSGRRVMVVGGGQSALEDAALLHEAGAEVEVLVRTQHVRWIPEGPSDGRGPVRRSLHALMYPPTDVGPPGLNWIAAAPDVFRHMPRWTRPEIGRRCTLPVGAAWLRPRLAAVRITMGRVVTGAHEAGGRAHVLLDDGGRREVDHVVAATGYRVDVSKYEFLGADLLRSIRLNDGYPMLSSGLESSVPGLHFVGAPAAATFGPVMRFVTGTAYCGPALARALGGRPPALVTFAF